jgi:hypothetical protein
MQKGQEVREAIVNGSLPLRGFIKKTTNKNKIDSLDCDITSTTRKRLTINIKSKIKYFK